MDGIIALNKPCGPTSHDMVIFLRQILKEKKIGHTGTLDPIATGVLVLGIGKGTKILEFLQTEPKEYFAQITFGINTDTLDLTGKILSINNCLSFSSKELEEKLSIFEGEILQTPPSFSALKFKGKKLYEYARQGKKVEVSPRKVKIWELKLLKFNPSEKIATIKIKCSKGTYVRSLVDNIGQKMGCGATLSSLKRLAVGEFSIETALPPSEIQKAITKGKTDAFYTLNEALHNLPALRVLESITQIKNGQILPLPGNHQHEEGQILRLIDKKDQCLAIGEVVLREGRKWVKPRKVLI